MGDVQVKASPYRLRIRPAVKAPARSRLVAAILACAPLAACDSLPALPTLSSFHPGPIFAGGQTMTHGYIFDDRVLDQIKPGMDVQEVLQKLGQPSNVSTVGNQTFYYASQTTYQRFLFQQPSIIDQRVFAIYFDKKFKVERLANWGLQDGKVFDFISRTTPSSGVEQSFLRQIFNGSTKLSPFAL
jgi:outer membrane protein assembly factor BamE (lipoprotein component of BamABCDE complex)